MGYAATQRRHALNTAPLAYPPGALPTSRCIAVATGLLARPAPARFPRNAAPLLPGCLCHSPSGAQHRSRTRAGAQSQSVGEKKSRLERFAMFWRDGDVDVRFDADVVRTMERAWVRWRDTVGKRRARLAILAT